MSLRSAFARVSGTGTASRPTRYADPGSITTLPPPGPAQDYPQRTVSRPHPGADRARFHRPLSGVWNGSRGSAHPDPSSFRRLQPRRPPQRDVDQVPKSTWLPSIRSGTRQAKTLSPSYSGSRSDCCLITLLDCQQIGHAVHGLGSAHLHTRRTGHRPGGRQNLCRHAES